MRYKAMKPNPLIKFLFVAVIFGLMACIFVAVRKSSADDQNNQFQRPHETLVLASDERAAKLTISVFLSACDRNDYVAALKVCAPSSLWGEQPAPSFERMIQTTAPEMAHTGRVEFLAATTNKDRNEMVERTEIYGKNGRTVPAAFLIQIVGNQYYIADIFGGRSNQGGDRAPRFKGPPSL